VFIGEAAHQGTLSNLFSLYCRPFHLLPHCVHQTGDRGPTTSLKKLVREKRMAGWIVWKGHVPPSITISSLPRHQRFLDLNYNREIREAGRTRGREAGRSGRLRTRMPGKDGAERPGEVKKMRETMKAGE